MKYVNRLYTYGWRPFKSIEVAPNIPIVHGKQATAMAKKANVSNNRNKPNAKRALLATGLRLLATGPRATGAGPGDAAAADAAAADAAAADAAAADAAAADAAAADAPKAAPEDAGDAPEGGLVGALGDAPGASGRPSRASLRVETTRAR